MLSVLISTAYSLASIVNVCVSVLFAGSISYVVVSTTATISYASAVSDVTTKVSVKASFTVPLVHVITPPECTPFGDDTNVNHAGNVTLMTVFSDRLNHKFVRVIVCDIFALTDHEATPLKTIRRSVGL